MLQILCGDDSIASREYLQTLKTQLKSKHYATLDIDAGELEELLSKGEVGGVDLFGQTTAYITSGLISVLKRRYPRKSKPEIVRISELKQSIIVDWEEKSSYDMGIDKEKWSFVKEFKAKETTFSLLESFYPGMATVALKKLDVLCQSQPIEVTFAMLCRHVRSMLLLSGGKRPVDSPYLVMIAQRCAAKWQTPKLLRLYETLFKLEMAQKTSSTPLTLRQNLQAAMCFLLA